MRCGASIIIASIVSFTVFMVGVFGAAAIEPWRNQLEKWHCEQYEEFVYETSPSSDGDGNQIQYYCRNVEGTPQHEVTDKVVISSVGVSAAVFVSLWLGLWILGSLFFRRRGAVASPQVIQFPQAVISTARWREIEKLLSDNGGTLFEGGDTLTDRLRQLAEARQNGLITDAEYESVRKAILDRMDD